jgi:hypothetical protein
MDGSGVISYTFSSTAVSPVISGLKITGDTDTEDTGTQFNLTVQLIDFYDNISAAQNSTQIYLDREGPVIAAGTLAGSASAISGITAADGASQAGVYTGTDFTSGYYEVSLHSDSAKTTMTTAPADIAMDYDSGSYRITYTLTFEADTQAVFQFRIKDKVGNWSDYSYAKLAMSGSSTYTVTLGDSAAATAWSMRIAGPVSVSGPSTPIAREALNIAASRSRNLAPPVTRAVQRRAAQAVEADNTLREAVSYTYVSNTQASRNYLKESVWRTAANTTVVRTAQNENEGTSAAESVQSSGASESAEAPLYLAVPASLTRPVENPERGKDDTVKTSVKAPVQETESGETVSIPRENINNAAFVSVIAGLVSGGSEAPAEQNPEKGGENGALGAIAPKAAPDGTIKRRARARGRRA